VTAVKRATAVIVIAGLLFALVSVYRALFQVQSLELTVTDPVLRYGTTVRVNARSSGRVPVDLHLEMVQQGHTETLIVRRIAKNEHMLDARWQRESLTFVMSPTFLSKFRPGPAVIRATGTGRAKWLLAPPPTVREVAVSIPAATETAVVADANRLSGDQARRIIERRAKDALASLLSHDMDSLSSFVHPTKGMRFSHYMYVQPGKDMVFTRSQVPGLWDDGTEYVWGEADGTGDPIRMTFNAYHRRWLNHDFSKAPRVAYNGSPFKSGNTPNNIAQVYPGSIAVEHHFPGFEPRYEGMDWASLWLVFEREKDEWFLVGVVRGNWTI
jgi:hypothetical protein